MLNARARQRIPVLGQARPHDSSLVIARDNGATRLSRYVQAFLRVGPVPHDVAEAHHHVDAALADIRQHAIERDEVAVNVRDDCDSRHSSTDRPSSRAFPAREPFPHHASPTAFDSLIPACKPRATHVQDWRRSVSISCKAFPNALHRDPHNSTSMNGAVDDIGRIEPPRAALAPNTRTHESFRALPRTTQIVA